MQCLNCNNSVGTIGIYLVARAIHSYCQKQQQRIKQTNPITFLAILYYNHSTMFAASDLQSNWSASRSPARPFSHSYHRFIHACLSTLSASCLFLQFLTWARPSRTLWFSTFHVRIDTIYEMRFFSTSLFGAHGDCR